MNDFGFDFFFLKKMYNKYNKNNFLTINITTENPYKCC